MRNIHVALLSAMPSEIGKTLDYLDELKVFNYGDLKIYQGYLKKDDFSECNVFMSVAWSGWGKVSAARACTRMISHASNTKPIDLILFTGVAGAIKSKLKQWDIVIPEKVIHHDLDATPIFEKYVIPGVNIDKLVTPIKWHNWIFDAVKKAKNEGFLNGFGNVSTGLVGTGDRFISSREEIQRLSIQIEELVAVEMEGAAVAQVAFQEKLPWVIVRVISDAADESAADNFNEFLKKYEANCWNLIKSILIETRNLAE